MTMGYDLAGRRTTQTLASGLIRAFTYDGASQIVSIIDTGAGAALLARWTFVYDGGKPRAYRLRKAGYCGAQERLTPARAAEKP